MRVAILFVAFLAFAGCLQGASVTPASTPAKSLPADWYAAPLAHDAGHDHKDVAQHENLSTPNFRLLGHDGLTTQHYGKPVGYGCGGVAEPKSGRRLSAVGTGDAEVPVVIVDVTDAARPTKVGEFVTKGMHAYDADITQDGKYVVLAFYDQTRLPVGAAAALELPSLSFRSSCGLAAIALPDAVAAGPGIVLLDLADPAKPTFADWDPMPERNLHSVSTATVDGVTWVVGSELGGPPRPPGSPVSTSVHALGYFAFDTIEQTPLGTKLVRQSTYVPPPATMGGETPAVPVRNGHTDVAIMKHPVDKRTYAYLADWEGGVLIVDLSQPAVPQLVGQWTPPHALGLNPNGDGPCYLSAIHEVLPARELWDGKHYLFAGQECPGKTDTKTPGGSVFVLDDTDPSKVNQVGSWHLPEDTGVWTVPYQASPHYLALVNRTLFIADYHAGIWAADVSTRDALKAPPSIGVFLPGFTRFLPPGVTDATVSDEQVDALADGTLVVIESTTGLYTLRFDAGDPAPPAPPFDYGAST